MSVSVSPPDDHAAPIVGRQLDTVGDKTIVVRNPVDLPATLRVPIASLLENRPQLAVMPIGELAFVQLIALDVGRLRVASSSCAAVLTGDL